MIEVLKSKLHCVQVTEANLNYMGSITIDEDMMDAAGMIAGRRYRWWTTTTENALKPMLSEGKGDRDASASTVLPPARYRWATR